MLLFPERFHSPRREGDTLSDANSGLFYLVLLGISSSFYVLDDLIRRPTMRGRQPVVLRSYMEFANPRDRLDLALERTMSGPFLKP